MTTELVECAECNTEYITQMNPTDYTVGPCPNCSPTKQTP